MALEHGDGGNGGGGGGGGDGMHGGAATGVLRCSSWAETQPTPLLLRRVCALAANAARCLHAAMLPSSGAAAGAAATTAAAAADTAAATDARMAAAMLAAFVPPIEEFDALLELDAKKLPRRHLQLNPNLLGGAEGGATATATAAAAAAARAMAAPKPFANMFHGQIARGVDADDAVDALVRALEARYGGVALFFYDRHGGGSVALKWRPRAFLPRQWKPSDAHGRLLLEREADMADMAAQSAEAAPQQTKGTPKQQKGEKGALGAPSWLLPNVPELLEAMVAMGGGLVKRARLVVPAPPAARR